MRPVAVYQAWVVTPVTIMPLADLSTSSFATAATAAVLGAAALAMLLWRRGAIAGTTMIGPWGWAVLSIVTVSAVEVIVAVTTAPSGDATPAAAPARWVDPLRYAAAMTSFCPLMALLGAKRPQDRAWVFIVLSLLLVLALPSAEVLLPAGRGPLTVHPLRGSFLLLLVAAGPLNTLLTRYWSAGILLAAGQVALAGPHLPIVARWMSRPAPLWGLGLIVLAAGMAAVAWPRGARASPPDQRVWIDFRDTYGVVWGLRVVQRLNQELAKLAGAPALTWHGWSSPDGCSSLGQVPPETLAEAQQHLEALLLRFVSRAWIERRRARA